VQTVATRRVEGLKRRSEEETSSFWRDTRSPSRTGVTREAPAHGGQAARYRKGKRETNFHFIWTNVF
jgi:hypothetical protein